jgi:hypothetical protein
VEVDGIQLAVGGTAVTALAGIAGAWIKARYGKTRVDPDPLRVEPADKFVTRTEFDRHVADNARDHENVFARLAANDKLTSKLEGILEGIRDDLKAIKDKLFRGKA